MQKILNLFCKKQNMQQQKYSPCTYNTKITTDITITPCKKRLCRKYYTCSAENKTCNNRNTAHGHTSQKKQQILHSAPCKNRLCRKSWNCSAENRICSSRNTPMYIHHRKSNRCYTQPPVRTYYAENPKTVLQKLNMQQQKYNHITETETETDT